MEVVNLNQLKEFSGEHHLKKELAVTEAFKGLLLCFEPGQAVEPCKMTRNTAFFFVEGAGTVAAGSEERFAAAGDIVLIPPGPERQIKARTRLVVLALQYD